MAIRLWVAFLSGANGMAAILEAFDDKPGWLISLNVAICFICLFGALLYPERPTRGGCVA